MKVKPSFIELVQHICERPRMFTLGGTYNEVVAFITGYISGNNTPIRHDEKGTFRRFVCLKNSFPSNYIWTYVIKECAKDDNDAISSLEKTILEFIELREKMTDEELMEFAISSSKQEESEAEKVFGIFDRALLTGEKEVIQSFILENDEAEVLWPGSYPEDVSSLLTNMAEGQPVKSIPLSEDGNAVKIIAPGWPFPIDMIFKNNEWKIDAGPIIEMWKANKSS